MANLGPIEFIIILAIVLLVFGVDRLSDIGGEMGSAIREFREGLRGAEEAESSNETNGDSAADGNT